MVITAPAFSPWRYDGGQGDAMAAATVFVPLEEYLRSSYSPDAEYVDGQIE